MAAIPSRKGGSSADMNDPDRFLIAGVMGWPVLHSRSPLIHNYWFEEHGLVGQYLPLEIPPDRLAAALRALPALGFSGCNLTIPHKERALEIVDDVDETARCIGAISCVVARSDGTLLGSNNDAFGFIESVNETQPGWRADRGPIAVVGAGGGARAVVWSLADRGAREIRLINRSQDRAGALAAEFGPPVQVLSWSERADALADVAMLVNTTSLGMVGQPGLDLDLAALPRRALVVDIVYTPLETPLLAAARRRGNATLNGLGMLLHQARPAWRAWFGVDPAVTPELRALVERTIPV
jgi:shikimate dehydrogenase